MSGQGGVVAVTCLALEASIARGPGVSVLCNPSIGLKAALGAAIARGAKGIISFGIAGGLAPELVAGDWVVASAVRTSNSLIATDRTWTRTLLDSLPGAVYAEVAGANAVVASPGDKFDLHRATGAAAVDMESHIAAQVAAEHRIPFVACRVIIDAAHRVLPPAATLGLRPDGKPNVPAIVRSVCRNPGQLPDLVRTAIDARVAERALRHGRRRLGIGMGFPGHKSFAFELAYA
jgi:hopanoid-associated phosphorylase